MKFNFLDATVFKVGNQLRTKIDTKPTDKQGYLHSKSEQPNSMKSSIAYTQALRLNNIYYNKRGPEKAANTY